MSANSQKSDIDKEIEKSIRMNREFSIDSGLGQSGGGMLDGVSTVPEVLQATAKIIYRLSSGIVDPSGVLIAQLQAKVKGYDVLISQHVQDPMQALKKILEDILATKESIHEFTRQVDVKYGVMFKERPHFQDVDGDPHPDDAYTCESVKTKLMTFLSTLS